MLNGAALARIEYGPALRALCPITSDLRQEPGAGKPHAGICAGGGEQSPSLPRQAAQARPPCDALEVVSPSSEGAAPLTGHAAVEQKLPSTPRGHFQTN